MAHLVINGTTFSGHPSGTGNQSAWQPTGYTASQQKIGVTLPAANGTRNRVERNVVKRRWEITWEATNATTIATLRTLAALMASFSFSDVLGTSYTVQVEDDDLAVEFAFADLAGNQYWTTTLTLYQV
jgi:hypothetical protein